jgi:4-amino-4-deoxy-L-arabinose transferase-like glycosyltransferase
VAYVDPERSRFDRGLLAILILAAVLRFWAWESVGLDHFDEGGYAMSARSIAEGAFSEDRYPLQHFLSPPFQFGTAGLVMLGWGVEDRLLAGLSAILGVATVGLVYLLATPLGRPAAVAAGLLVALSDFHVLYSRSGLTDVAFGFWFLCALLAFARAERRASWAWAIGAGVATGLAWNTKYHGWLAVVVAGAAVVLGLLQTRDVRAFARGAARVVLAGIVAAALYAPWAYFVSEQPGGYARLVEEHSLYLRPLRAHRQAWTHVNTQLYLDGWLGRLAPLLGAVALAAWTGKRGSPPGDHARGVVATATDAPNAGARLGRAGLVGAVGLVLGNSLYVGMAALVGVVSSFRIRDPGIRVALAFLAVFTVLTPLYYPYPRLVLPWLLAGSVLAGAGTAHLVAGGRSLQLISPLGTRALRVALGAAVVVLMAVAVRVRPPWEAASTFRAKDGFRTAATDIAGRIPTGSRVVVWGEPGVVFYLRDSFAEVRHIDAIEELGQHSSPEQPLYLVTSIYAGRIGGDQGLDAWRSTNPDALREVGSAPVRDVSDVRLLDDFGPRGAAEFLRGENDAYDLRLFEVRRGAPR